MLDEKHNILIASREKAVADILYFTDRIENIAELQSYLFDNLRIEEAEIMKLKKNDIKQLAKYLLNPIPFSVNTYKIPYLFAGKMHAILCREWKTRVKGRDWSDFVWYVGKNARLDLKHLENRMCQSGHISQNGILSKKKFLKLLDQRIANVDFEQAKNDVAPFIKDQGAVQVWSKDFFREVAKRVMFD